MSLFLGVDIGQTAIKVVALRTAYRKLRLEGMVLVELSELGGDKSLAAQTALTRLFPGKLPTIDGIAIALPGELSSQKKLALPASTLKQIADVLPFELEAELPFDLTEAVWDYRIVNQATVGKTGELDVRAVVARVADVRERIDFVKAALGHEPERVGVGAFPLGNLTIAYPALATNADDVVALLDLGTVQSDLLILQGGQVVFSRTLSFGTKGLPETAARLARELRTSVAAHRAQGGIEPSRVVLAGGGGFVPGADVFLSSELGLPVELLGVPALELGAVPSDKKGAPAQVPLALQQELGQVARYAKALGLALGHTSRAVDFDLRRGPLSFERGFGWMQERLPQLVGFAVVLGVAFLLSTMVRMIAISQERGVLEEALAQVTLEVLGEETSDPERADELLAGHTESADPDPLPHYDAFDVMHMFSQQVPEDVVHDIEELDVQKGHVMVHGIVGSVSEAQDILTKIKDERCVADAKIGRTNQVVGSDRQKYVLEFDMRCPEDVKAKDKKKPATAAPAGDTP